MHGCCLQLQLTLLCQGTKAGLSWVGLPVQECWTRCSRDAKCEMWVWCGHKAGCDDAGEFNGVYPHHGCQLMQLAKVRNTALWLLY